MGLCTGRTLPGGTQPILLPPAMGQERCCQLGNISVPCHRMRHMACPELQIVGESDRVYGVAHSHRVSRVYAIQRPDALQFVQVSWACWHVELGWGGSGPAAGLVCGLAILSVLDPHKYRGKLHCGTCTSPELFILGDAGVEEAPACFAAALVSHLFWRHFCVGFRVCMAGMAAQQGGTPLLLRLAGMAARQGGSASLLQLADVRVHGWRSFTTWRGSLVVAAGWHGCTAGWG